MYSDEEAIKLAKGMLPSLTRPRGEKLLKSEKIRSHRKPFPVDVFFTKEGIKVAEEIVKAQSSITGKTERFTWPLVTERAVYGLGLLKALRAKEQS